MEDDSGLEGRLRSLIVNNAKQNPNISSTQQDSNTKETQNLGRGRGRNKYRQKLDLDPKPNGLSAHQRPINHSPVPRLQQQEVRGRGKLFQTRGYQNGTPSEGPESNYVGPGSAPRSQASKFTPLQRTRLPTPDELDARGFFLEQLAARELPQMEMTLQEYHAKDAFRARLQELAQGALKLHVQHNPPPIELIAFGSLSTGFGMPGSDMDLALVTPSFIPDMFRIFEKAFLEAGLGARLLTKTRVPIIKVCEKPRSDLYTALCEERRKWDGMTPEEREKYDRPERREDNEPKSDEKDSLRVRISSGEVAEGHTSRNEGFGLGGMVDSISVTGKAGVELGNKQSKQGHNGFSANHKEGAKGPDNANDSFSGQKQARGDPPNAFLRPGKDSSGQATHQAGLLEDAPGEKKQEWRPQRPWYRERYLGALDFPKTGVGIQCDINFSNPLGLHNTHLLRCYSDCDVRVRLMVLFVKAWASRRKINSPYNGTLSSYGYVLMVLHFLVNVARPNVCPNLQLSRVDGMDHGQAPNPSDPNAVCEGCDVRFWRDEERIMDLAMKNRLTENKELLGILLRDFFQYYAQQGPDIPCGGFVWTRDVLSLRTPGGLLSKPIKGWTGAKVTLVEEREVRHRYLFAIEDPFELDHNVARTVTHNGICAIRDEFRRAWRMIVDSGRGIPVQSDLFEEVVSIRPRPEDDGKENDLRNASEGRTSVKNNSKMKSEAKAVIETTTPA